MKAQGWRGLGQAVTSCLNSFLTSNSPYLAKPGVASLLGSIIVMEKLSTIQGVLPNKKPERRNQCFLFCIFVFKFN